jgi:hypothetical protein
LCALFLLFTLCSASAIAETYKGQITLPIDLYTTEGTGLPKGKYEIQVNVDKQRFLLSFHSAGKSVAELAGHEMQGDLFNLPATVPLVGTQYLRSSAEPVQTAQERQYSKTGLPQYAEEARDWKATMRVYKSDVGSVFFVFQLGGKDGRYRRVDFKLRPNKGESR